MITSLLLGLALAPLPPRVNLMINIADRVMVERTDRWFMDGQWDHSIQSLDFRRAMFPDDYDVVTDYGFLLENSGEGERALKAYREFAVAAPSDKDRLLPEASYWFKMKNYARLIEMLPATLSAKPHPNHYRMLYISYEKTGKLKEAVAICERLLADYPDDLAAKAKLDGLRKKIAEKS